MIEASTARVGLLRLTLDVPGSRSLKDRRRAVVSLRDRIRGRFDVACHEIDDRDLHNRTALLVLTGGLDAKLVERVIDQIVALASADGDCLLSGVDREILVWPSSR